MRKTLGILSMPDLDSVVALSREIREFLEPKWVVFRQEKHFQSDASVAHIEPNPPSVNMCRLTARFLHNRLENSFPEGKWKIRGGSEDMGMHGGIRDPQGEWHGHYWLKAHDGTIVDVTADQFGWEPVIVTRNPEILTHYKSNYTTVELNEHMKWVRFTSSKWTDAWNMEHLNNSIQSPSSVI